MRAAVVGAVVTGLPAYFMVFVDDGVPAVAGTGVLTIAGCLVIIGTIVTGLALVTWKPTRRLGIGLLLGGVVTFVVVAVALFVFLLWVVNTVGA